MGSFKFRGAYNRCASLPPERRPGGVVAYSSATMRTGRGGRRQLRHAGGDRDAGRRAGPRERTAALGAGGGYDREKEDRAAIAGRIADERGAVIVRPLTIRW